MEKSQLRKLAKEWIKDLGDQKEVLDQQISQHINSLIHDFKTGKQLFIGAYRPMKDEVVWDKAFAKSEDIIVSYPVMTPDKSLIYLAGDLEVTPDILLVPGLMFSPEGYRLGRGGGYFDRFLPKFKGRAFGITYEKRIGEVPFEAHDVQVDGLVTEAGWRIYKSEEKK